MVQYLGDKLSQQAQELYIWRVANDCLPTRANLQNISIIRETTLHILRDFCMSQ